MTQPRVGDVGEEGLLAQIFPLLPAGRATLLGPGDDAAVIAAPDGRFVVTTDVLVEGRHFRHGWGTATDLGWRAAMQNLADVAAMGARPTAIVVGLVLPADVEVAWVLDLARGLAEACEPHGVGVVGGDLTGGEQVVITVTAHGDLEGRPPIRRDGARPGDVLALAGSAGRAAAGLALLTAHGPQSASALAGSDGELAGLVTSFLRPQPPLELGLVAAERGASAMMDVSDGLLRDAGRVARASKVRIDVDPVALEQFRAPLEGAGQLAGQDPLTWVLTGGEDHGLLATFPRDVAVPPGFAVVGRVLDAASEGATAQGATARGDATAGGAPGVVVGGEVYRGSPGWDHFGGR